MKYFKSVDVEIILNNLLRANIPEDVKEYIRDQNNELEPYETEENADGYLNCEPSEDNVEDKYIGFCSECGDEVCIVGLEKLKQGFSGRLADLHYCSACGAAFKYFLAPNKEKIIPKEWREDHEESNCHEF